MHTHGNPNQWNDGHPAKEDLSQDIEQKQLYVLEDENGIQGAFVFYIGEDPTYKVIKKGSWRNDLPYAAVHKVASSREVKGIGTDILRWCKKQYFNIRMDTHADNIPMQHLLAREGFVPAGEIYLQNGDPRIAYHYVQNETERSSELSASAL
jgi:RimJ/RimL family protein N-acetyltransferase